MAALIAFLIGLGIITSPSEMTDELYDQYHHEIVIVDAAEI